MDELFIQHAETYAALRQIQLAERLGSGVHGIIFAADNKLKDGKTAIKVHREREPFLRELAVYQRLADARIVKVAGMSVPKLIAADEELQIIEMSVVTRPFVLDFAGAYLDKRPEFSEEIWTEWEAAKREQFGEQWAKVQEVLEALRDLDIYMVDISPSNIAFSI